MNRATIGEISIKDRLALYQEECRKKKERKKYDELEVHELDKSSAAFLTTPKTDVKPAAKVDKLNDSFRQIFELEFSNNDSHSTMHVDDDLLPPSSPRRMREKEEVESREKLCTLLSESDGTPARSTKIPAFTSVRNRYMKAVTTFQPVEIKREIDGLSGEEYAHRKKETIVVEAYKKKKYGTLKHAWDRYEGRASDKPLPSAEEKKIQKQLDTAENNVDKAWVGFASTVVDLAEEDGDEDDLAYWENEAMRLTEQAMARRKRIAEARKRCEQAAKEGKLPEPKSPPAAVADDDDGDDGIPVHNPGPSHFGGRPGLFRGSSFDSDEGAAPEKPQRVKDDEERVARNELCDILVKTDGERRTVTRIPPFTQVRTRYLKAVGTYEPVNLNDELSGLSGVLYSRKKKELVRREAEKRRDYARLKTAWGRYEDVAQDKPTDPTDEEKAIQAKIDVAETEVDDGWQNFADSVVEKAEEDGDNMDDNDDLAFWAAEAKRLKEEAEARRRRKQAKCEQEEKEYWKKEGEKLRDAAREGVGVENPYDSDDEGEDDDDNGDDSNQQDETEPSESHNDGDDASGSKKKANKKKGKGADSDSDSSDSEDEDDGKKKKKDKKKNKKGKKKKKGKESPPETPKPAKDKVELKEDELPTTPRNEDGSLWKNPLNRWTNKPKKKIIEKGTKIMFKIPPKTDCWRKTRHNFIMDNAPYNWHKVSGDFEVSVKVTGGFSKIYDKAGIQVRVDEETWITTGMECFNDRMHHSTCVTRDHSDWSLSQLPEGVEEAGCWFCLKRVGNTIETFYSFDAMKWVQTRQCLFSDKTVMQVGISGACPMGDEFKVTFDHYRVRSIR